MSDRLLAIKSTYRGKEMYSQSSCVYPDEPKNCILVMAFGNSLRGDDGVGKAVLERLAKCGRLTEDIYIQCNASPINLLEAVLSHRFRRVILVDAAYMQEAPGVWQRISLQGKVLFSPTRRSAISMHDFGLAEVMELTAALNRQLPEIILYAVQPQEVKLSDVLSDAVQEAVPTICCSILEDLSIEGVSNGRKGDSSIRQNQQ